MSSAAKSTLSRSAEDGQRIAQALGEHFSGVWRTLRRFGVHERHADDVAQQVFVVFAERVRDVEHGRERAYLIGVAIKLAANARRRQARDPEELVERDEAPGSARDPESLLQQRQRRERLDQALASLPDEQREVFVLYELEGFSLPEIARLLQVPLGTATSRLRRARSSFEAWVAAHCPTRGTP